MYRINQISQLFFVFFLFFNVYLISDIFINYPFLDDFEAIVIFMVDYFKTVGIGKTTQLIFSQHNDFRLVVLRLIVLGDYYLFGTINFIHFRILGFTVLLSCLYFLFKYGKFEMSKFYFFLPVPMILISFACAEIHTLAMESLSHFVVIFFAITTFYNLIKKDRLVVAIILMIFGVFSNGNGLLIVPICAFYLLLKKDYIKLFWWSLSSIVVGFVFFTNYRGGNIPIVDLALIKRIIYVFPIYLGGIGGLESIKLNQFIGIIGVLLTVYFLIYKNTVKYYPTKSALLIFFFGTYFLIAAKRDYADAIGLLRGAYLINSIFVFILFYILFYHIHLSKWVLSKRYKLSMWSFSAILVLCFIYQARNYTKWIQEFGAQKNAINSVMLMVNGNTKLLYQDNGMIYNQPLNRRWGIDTLVKKGVFDNSTSIKALVVAPSKLDSSKINGSFDDQIQILSLDGLQIRENPYITVTAIIKSFIKNPSNSLGIALLQNNKTSYYEIPIINDKLFFLKSIKNRDCYVKFLIAKKDLVNSSFNISFLKFENNSISKSKFHKEIRWNKNPLIHELEATPEKLTYEKGKSNNLTKNKFYEAYYKDNIHRIVLNLDSLVKDNANFLELEDPISLKSFQLKLKPESSNADELLASVTISQKIIAKFLNQKDTIFKLSLVSKNSENQYTNYPLNSLYFFEFH